MEGMFFYIAIFALVFGGYLTVDLLWSSRSQIRMKAMNESLPLLYRLGSIPIMFLAMAIGEKLVSLQPKKTEYLRKQLLLAHLKLDVKMIFGAQIFLILLLMTLIFIFLMILRTDMVWLSIGWIISIFVGWFYPVTIIESAAAARREELIKNLPFAIDLIASAMQAGLDFGAAIRYWTQTSKPNALQLEFGIVLKQIELGKTRIEALLDMDSRLQTDEFSTFVSAVVHGTEVGASIIETLRIQGAEMRRRRFALAEQKAMRAPSLMILPLAIFILPSVFIIIFTPIYIRMQGSGLGGTMG